MLRHANSLTNLENRLVWVSTIDLLYQEALLNSALDRVGEVPSPFLTGNDLLCALWKSLLLASTGAPQTSGKAVVLKGAYSLRKILFWLVCRLGWRPKHEASDRFYRVFIYKFDSVKNHTAPACDLYQRNHRDAAGSEIGYKDTAVYFS